MTQKISNDQAMQMAIRAGDRARLVSRPNPWVGAVVVSQDGEIFEGSTSRVGGSHAEIIALNQAGEKTNGATLYTTLEPCAHVGRTAPCTQAIIHAGIKHVVIGIIDPDEKVAGRGIAELRQAGLEVTVGVCGDQITKQLAPYLHHRTTRRPFVVLKMAATLDGRTSAPDGTAMWITGEPARRRVHQLRAESDAVLVGSRTVASDDPLLTVRDVDGQSPRRIVLGAVSPNASVNPCTQWGGSLVDLLDELGSQDVIQLLVEGGPTVAGLFHQQGLINQYIFHFAPALSGGNDSNPILAGQGISTISELWRGKIVSIQQIDDDFEVILEPRKD